MPLTDGGWRCVAAYTQETVGSPTGITQAFWQRSLKAPMSHFLEAGLWAALVEAPPRLHLSRHP